MDSRWTIALTAWLLTYIVHSTVLFGGAWLIERWRTRFAEAAWRISAFAGIATASFQTRSRFDPLSQIRTLQSGVSHHAPVQFLFFVGLWIAGAAIALALLVQSRRRLSLLLADRTDLSASPALDRLRQLAAPLQISATVSPRVQSPMVVGRRELCLPSSSTVELSQDELDAVLAHELAHIRRRDPIWLFAAALVQRVMWLQPLNLYALRRIRALAECSCDDWAVAQTGAPMALASALSLIAGRLTQNPVPEYSVGLLGQESLAVARVRRMLDPAAPRLGGPQKQAHLLAIAFALFVATVAPRFSEEQIQYTVSARDSGGPFTVTVKGGDVVGMTIDGRPVQPSRLVRSRNHLRVLGDDGRAGLDIILTDGGIRWTSRPPRTASR